jgi:hypothetical protein
MIQKMGTDLFVPRRHYLPHKRWTLPRRWTEWSVPIFFPDSTTWCSTTLYRAVTIGSGTAPVPEPPSA